MILNKYILVANVGKVQFYKILNYNFSTQLCIFNVIKNILMIQKQCVKVFVSETSDKGWKMVKVRQKC